MGAREEMIDLIQVSSLPSTGKATLTRLIQLTTRSAEELTGEELAAVRVAAGLTQGQAARLIHDRKAFIRDVEELGLQGDKKLGRLFNKIYGLTPAEPEGKGECP